MNALLESGKFTVTAITRISSKSNFPSGVKVASADLSSVESVTAALKGQDAVVSAVGTEGLQGQSLLIDAAVAAGVKRFLPSDFGCDLADPKASALPVFGYKIATHKHIKEAAAANPNFTYSLVSNGPFLDWALNVHWMIDTREGKPQIYDGGRNVFSTTTLPSVGKAVVGVLSHPEETKNRFVYVKDADLSQKKLFEMAKKIAPQTKWEPIEVSTAEVEKSSNESLAKGEVNQGVMFGYLNRAVFGEGYGGQFQKDDNALLGLPYKSDAEIEALLKSAMSA